MIVELFIFFALMCLIIIKLDRKPDGLPPGEWGWPIIGYIPSSSERTTDLASRLRAKHGNTFYVKIGTRIFVFLTDCHTIKTALAKLEFAGRPDFYTFQIFRKSRNVGLILSHGSVWNSNRRFALRILRDFGLGKSRLEDSIQVEVKSLVTYLRSKAGKPTKIERNLNIAVLNVLWGLVAGKRFDINDPEIINYSQRAADDMKYCDGPVEIFNFFPWLASFIPAFAQNRWMKVELMERNRDLLFDYLLKIIKEHETTLDREHPRDYIDMYIAETEKQSSALSNYDNYFDLISSLDDLFLAGSDTTSMTIRWFFSYMAKYPEIQKRIQREIDAVVPKERFPSLEEKEKLPYFEASLYDLQRIISLGPVALPHTATEDTTLNGFRIPKGAIISPCLELCHKSPEHWERPNQLYPEHFLDKNGKFYIPKEGFLPFSVGKRQCLGEPVAKMELFLFCGAILQNFEICEPEGQPISLDVDPEIKFFNQPKSCEYLIKERI